MNNTVSKIANALLKDVQLSKQFFAEDDITLADINVEVEGVGNIDFPLTEDGIERLVSVSSKAKFGLREQTLLDENVRNTNEIAGEKLRVTIEPSIFSRVLNKMRGELGLAENSDLTAHLHNMLIYSRGQFFHKHQDTEKMDNMIATLVIVLPSSHVGGELIIHQGDKKHVFSTENINGTCIKCIAFYADCFHEIENVQFGHRVALTYNLVLHSTGVAPFDTVNQELEIAIKQYFEEMKQSNDYTTLVYFLNHEYSEYGLRWNMLKGRDRTNVRAILQVANNLNLIHHLALTKIQESYDTDEFEEDPDPDKLKSTEVIIFHWLDGSSKKLPYGEMTFEESEICYTKSTLNNICCTKSTLNNFEPYESRYEGYLGNEGCETKFWYRRAAVVLWEKSSQIALNFFLNHQNALEDLLELTRSEGNQKRIQEIIQEAGKHLYNDFEHSDDCFIILTKIALYLNDKDAAHNLLSGFCRTVVNVATAESLAKLQNKYGIDWCINILNKFEFDYKNYVDYKNYDIDKIDFFMKIFVQNGGALKVGEMLLDKQSIEEDEYVYHFYVGICLKLPERFKRLHQLFTACATLQNVPILDKIINLVIANPSKYRIVPLVDLFLNLKNEIPSCYYINFKPLKTYLLRTVNDELALGEHSDNDWSISVKMSCDCVHCKEALRFLNSKTEVQKCWFLQKDLRDHVSNRLRGLRLPLKITVERSHKLTVEKDISMRRTIHERYKEIKSCQEKLEKHTFE